MYFTKNRSKILFTKLVTVILTVVLSFGILDSASADLPTQKNFVVKLRSADSFAKLRPYTKKASLLFERKDDENLNFIYSIETKFSENEIKNILGSELEYLENTQTFVTMVVAANDPGFTDDYSQINKQWGLVKTTFPVAWSKIIGSKSNLVAIIDTGVDATHEDLKAVNYVEGYDFFANQAIKPGTDSDDNGHGTLVAGILGATVNNGVGIAGTNWEISIMPLKALDKDGKGDSVKIAEAIVRATDKGAKFINLSVGGLGSSHSQTLSNAISYAFKKNVVIVAAAGNDSAVSGTDLDKEQIFPICDDNDSNMVIGVTAVDFLDQKPDFANYGKNCIDVVAPGKRILSTINFDPLTKKHSPNSYAYASGSSMSVPFVVGQAMLIKSLYPLASNVQIRDRILSTADPIDQLNLTQCSGQSCKGKLGLGRINVNRSLDTEIISPIAREGDLIKSQFTGTYYVISGGKKRPVSPFVFSQQYLNTPFKVLNEEQIEKIQEGPYAMPVEGTLVKEPNQKDVYLIYNSQKFPVTSAIFKLRKYNFSDVKTVSFSELNSWPKAGLLPPPEGTIVQDSKTRERYWVLGGELHKIDQNFIQVKGIGNFPRIILPKKDIDSMAKGLSYI